MLVELAPGLICLLHNSLITNRPVRVLIEIVVAYIAIMGWTMNSFDRGCQVDLGLSCKARADSSLTVTVCGTAPPIIVWRAYGV